jgi:hypothetical protein
MTSVSLKSFEELVSSEAFATLSQAARDEFAKALGDARAAASEIARFQAQVERENRERREREAGKRKKLLGLDMGEWVRNIPRNRRFVLAYRDGRRFVGLDFQRDDPSKWKQEDQYVCMDLLRGYKSPYFEYGCVGPILDRCVYEKLAKAFEAKDDEELADLIRLEYDFFEYDKKDEAYDAKRGGIAIAEYAVDENNHVTITGRGPMKPLKQHQEDLRKEFGNG